MRYFLLSIVLLTPLCLVAQNSEFVGNYEFYKGNDDTFFLKDQLTLNADGTFVLISESYIEERMERHRKELGKGTWSSNKKLIVLTSDATDINDKYTLNLSNTKLRYITKSPRDQSDRDIKTSVRVIASDIFWLKGRTLIKNANTTAVVNDNKCCTSLWHVHSYLNGKWKVQTKPDYEHHYTLKHEKLVYDVYKKESDDVLVSVNENPTPITILKSDDNFVLKQNHKGLKVSYTIKKLTNSVLILIRQDGKESILYKIKS